MRVQAVAIAVLLSATPALALQPDPITVDKIMQVLAGMNCQMAPEDIEVEETGYELDDVICAGGQFDITMNEDLHIIGARGE